jgi:parallel beta-helix repeat protein
MKRRIKTWTIIAFAVCLATGVSAIQAHADATISGTGPFTISQDTQLSGDVDCSSVTTQDCITFGSDDLQLDLNGYTVKGPMTTCSSAQTGPFTSGIADSGHKDLEIKGPGKVEHFLVGIIFNGSSQSRVRRIVIVRNCHFGILAQIGFSNNTENHIEIENNIVLNNGTPNSGFLLGGIDIDGNQNDVRNNEVHGNADFGIRIARGTGNRIEQNSVTTNGHYGIRLDSSGNQVNENIVLNNITNDDIFSGGTNNVTNKNVCEVGAGTTVCHDSPTPPFDTGN